ncbi:hypothetical protein [Mesobacillus subterraneus]|uniref:hypothetical protein n=1 Tax=Mesobacillus subterraneus TaxID=285983 RepID=UPI001473BC54|nr:hypothetical protein [Mesobacillus subterraneus]
MLNNWIVAEGTETPPKMLTHFHRAWAGSRKSLNVLREKRVLGDPAGAKATRRLRDRPRKAKRLERKSTG